LLPFFITGEVMEKIFKTTVNGREFSIKGGKIAKQASGSVIVQYGETIVLVTAVASKEPKAEISFLPLSVEYQEKIYSAGRIPGNYFRREIGRPSEKETLTARLIDRPIRPLFEDDYNFETQVIATVLSMDKINEPDILAMAGASAALEISDIPFSGPIAGIKVGRIDGRFVANPTIEQMKESDIELVVAGSKTGVVMVEGGADIVSEKDMLDAIFFGHEALQPIIDLQVQLKQALGKEKRPFNPPERDEELMARVIEYSKDKIHEQVQIKTKIERQKALSALKDQVVEHFIKTCPDGTKDIKDAFSKCVKKVSRDIVLKEDKRIDGRAFDEIRQIECEVGNLPRPHGSALFTRGETRCWAF
jgi:polyribonucleotide nucleotidyltransferase